MTTPTKTTATKKTQPAPAPEPQKSPTRNDLLARLAGLKYDGPTSYTATVIKDELLPWVEAGCPADGVVPTGAMQHLHPSAKPTAARRPAKQYLAACTELRAAIADGTLSSVKAITAHLDTLLAEHAAE